MSLRREPALEVTPISKSRGFLARIIALLLITGILAPIVVHHSAGTFSKPRPGPELMFKAARAGNREELKKFADQGFNLKATRPDGKTLLHVAAENGRADCVKWLLEHGANVNVRAKDGSTPLHLAARLGRDDAAERLIEFRADPNIRDRRGNTPLHVALLETDSRTETGREDTGKVLLWSGADLTIRNNDGETALNASAARYGTLLESMLEKGADPLTRDKNGDTPLHHIVQNRENEMRRRVQGLSSLLIERGVSINARNLAGETPLHRAAVVGNTRAADFLLSSGADPSLKDNGGRTPFQTPGWQRHQLAVQLAPIALTLCGLLLAAETFRAMLRKPLRRVVVFAVILILVSVLLPTALLRFMGQPDAFLELTLEIALALAAFTFTHKLVTRCYSHSLRLGNYLTGILFAVGLSAFLSAVPLTIFGVLPMAWWTSKLTVTVLYSGIAAGAMAASRGVHKEMENQS